MGKRLTRIYTRTGDRGDTGLGDGSRTEKDSVRVEAMGEVDELNAFLATILAEEPPAVVRDCLLEVQNDLFDLGGQLAVPGRKVIDQGYVTRLERYVDTFNTALPPLENFILPGGGRAAALCHVARAVCRRAERRVVALARKDDIGSSLMAYLNRLSDLLFVLARTVTPAGRETLWRPGGGRSG